MKIGYARVHTNEQNLGLQLGLLKTGGSFVLHGMGALSKLERTKLGMSAAKKLGEHVGRSPALITYQLEHARRSIYSDTTIARVAVILKLNPKTLSIASKATHG